MSCGGVEACTYMREHLQADDNLILLVASGDREAFAQLYRKYREPVYRFAVFMSGSPVVADDVVQDVFVAVIEDATRYQLGRSGAPPWLLGIARNHVRWRSQSPALPLPDDERRRAGGWR